MNPDPRDCECTLNELDLFSPITKQISLEKYSTVDIYPLNNITQNAPIEFNINGSSDELIDLKETMLVVRAKIVNAANNANLIANDVIAPVNNWFHSMFSDVIMTMGGVQIEGGNQHYPYRAYLQNLLTYGKAAKETKLQAEGWYEDTPGQMSNAANNTGFASRRTLVQTSATVELAGPLLLDFMLQGRYALQNIDIGIKLIPSKPEFQCMIKTGAAVPGAAVAVKVVIQKAVLYVRRVKAADSEVINIEQKLNLAHSVYPMNRTAMTTYTIPQGSTSHNRESLFRGLMPKLIVVGFVRNDAFNGLYTQNPFDFKNYDIQHLALYREGASIPFRPFTPHFENNLYVREYQCLYQALEKYNLDDDVNITMNHFQNGYTLFAFNLTPDMNVAGHAQPIRDGNIRLEVKFGTATPQTVNVIVMGIFDSKLEITKFRNVDVNWKS